MTPYKQLPVDIIAMVDDHFPGWVKCVFQDAFGKSWELVEKVPVVTAEPISTHDDLPVKGYIAGRILCCSDGIACFDTKIPCGIEATDGTTQFHISISDLVDVDE